MKKCYFRTVSFEEEQAEILENQISDLLCWLSGFKAAGGKYDFGYDLIQELNIQLKKGGAK